MLLCLLIFSFGTHAQTNIVIGTGTIVNNTTTYPAPYGNFWWGARHQFMVTQTELLTAGFSQPAVINSLAFNVQAMIGVPLQNFTIQVGTTAAPDLQQWQTGLTTTYSVPNYTEVLGWNTHSFTTPFVWTGGNLVIEVCFNNTSFTNNAAVQQSNTTYISTRHYRADAAGVCINTNLSGTFMQRPNMRFDIAPSAPPLCAANTTPAASATNVCPINTTFSWQPDTTGGFAAGYYFFLGTNGGGVTQPTNVNNGTLLQGPATIYALPSQLQNNTTYYWQIIPYNSLGGPTSCAISSFTTGTGLTVGNVNASAMVVCQNTSTILSSTGHTGNLQWQQLSPTAGWINIGGINANPLTVFPSQQTSYQAVFSNGSCSNVPSQMLVINVVPPPIAGTAAVSNNSICAGDSITLILNGAVGMIQWQKSTNGGSSWTNETGTGANTFYYSLTPSGNAMYRAQVGNGNCPAVFSNTLTVTVSTVVSPTTAGATRCGVGAVTLTASGNGVLTWYANAQGGQPIGFGPTFTPFINSTNTFYVTSTSSTSTQGGGILITECDLGGTDILEIQNVTGSSIDVTGWKVAVSNSYTNINAVNPIVKTLSGILAPGQIMYWTDFTGTSYWGNDILWNPGTFPTTGGWALILNASGLIADFAVWNWTTAQIIAMNTVVGGTPITIGTAWTGDGINSSTASVGLSLSRKGTSDNNVSGDFAVSGNSINATNPNLQIPFQGNVCESIRVPVVATSTPAPAVSVTASNSNLCAGMQATLTATSNNPAYTYSWSPANWLSSATGASVTATPQAPIMYYVTGNDGTCAYTDSIYINTAPPPVAGVASTGNDTICGGLTVLLTLNGSAGSVQWQRSTNGGFTWTNETGSGSNTTVYAVAPPSAAMYRAIVSNAGCVPVVSNTVNITLTNVTAPTTIGDTRCNPGVVNLTASGPGTLHWYSAQQGGVPINTGNNFSPYLLQSTNFYVVSLQGGSIHNVGPTTNTIGPSTPQNGSWGLSFDVAASATLDRVYVYPAGTGNITINLRQGMGPVLNSVTVPVSQLVGRTAVDLDFQLSPGNGYRLELALGGVALLRNSAGGSYPYAVSGSPVSITGYFNPNPGTLPGPYMFFYDWQVTTGCRSLRIPVTGEIVSSQKPTITTNGNSLVSSATANYQWYTLGAQIPGATAQVFFPTTPGYYYVVTIINGCPARSDSVYFSFVGVNDIDNQPLFKLYPNPAIDKITIRFLAHANKEATLRVFDAFGKLLLNNRIEDIPADFETTLDVTNYPSGMYLITAETDGKIYHQRVVITKH